VSSGEVLSFRQINAIGSCKFRSDLEEEVGFKLFDRLPRGVKINAAGKSLLDDARHILQEVNDATARAKRIAAGQSGTLRLGYVQSLSWRGIVPESLKHFREHRPDTELQLKPLSSSEQFPAVRSGSLDAGYVYTMATPAAELGQFEVGSVNLLLATPNDHPIKKRKQLRLKNLVDVPFIWFPRRSSPVFFDHGRMCPWRSQRAPYRSRIGRRIHSPEPCRMWGWDRNRQRRFAMATSSGGVAGFDEKERAAPHAGVRRRARNAALPQWPRNTLDGVIPYRCHKGIGSIVKIS
jgi:DNA-binding transcriptional LysR family regulator